MSPNRSFSIFFLIIMALLSGCGHKEPYKDLKQHITEIKKQKSNQHQDQKISTLHMPTIVKYQMNAARSPFQSMSPAPTKTRASSNPLQTFSISMLRFVGTMSIGQQTIAYVLAPNNMVYKVKEGDLIGIEDGKVVRIVPNLVSILEQDLQNGKPTKRVVTLQLKDER